MKKLLCCLLCLFLITATACSDAKKASVNKGDNLSDFEKAMNNGEWIAPYKETFNYSPLFDKSSPYSAVGENLIKKSSFDGAVVNKGGAITVDNWSEQGVWSDAYTVQSGVGVDGSAALRFYQAEAGESQTYARYLLNVESNTRYVLTAKLKSVNLSSPAIKVSGNETGALLGQTAGGFDDFWDEVSFVFDTGENKQVVITFLGNSENTEYINCLSGTSYLDDLCVYKTANTDIGRVEHDYRLDPTYSYGKWQGQTPSGYRWGISEMWWYNNAKVFSYNAVPTVYCPDSRYFYLSGRPKSGKVGYFGFEITWEWKLEKGYGYQFSFNMPFVGEDPDIITVNDKIVWTNAYDKYDTYIHKNGLVFEYVPTQDEYVRIRFICESGIERGKSTNCSRRILPPPNGNWTERSIICQRTDLLKAPNYTKYDLHKDTDFISCSETEGAKLLRSNIAASVAIDSIAEIPKVDYKVSDTIVYDLCLNILEDDCLEAAKRLKIDSLTFIPHQNKGTQNFEKWAKRAKSIGVKHMKLYTVMPLNDRGDYEFTQLITMAEKSPEALQKGLKATAEVANRWLELVPDGKVTICFCEMESWFGMWDKGIENTVLGTYAGYESVKDGGLQAYYTIQNYLKGANNTLLSMIDKREQACIMYNTSRAGFDLTNLVNSGADIIYSKGTNRSSYNITLASARGAGNSFDMEFGVGWDTYDRDYWYGFGNDAVRTGFLSLFHGGVDGIFNEIPCTSDKGGNVSTQGAAWLDGIRYAKTHPEVGKTVVNIGIVRGEGDDWFRCAGKSAAWEQSDTVYWTEMFNAFRMENVSTKWAAAAKTNLTGKSIPISDTYWNDYTLLDVIFADYCDSSGRTDMERVFTGTPYGPANIISDTTSLDKLMQYDTLMYCGRGQTITKEKIARLEEYVEKGGNLIIAAGQLKDADSKLVTDKFAGISLTKQKIVDGLPYTYIEGNSSAKKVKIVDRHKNGDPLALYSEFGKGTVTLFSGEYLTSYDADVTREVLTSYLEQNTAVTFSKNAKYIEYTPNIKGKSLVIPFINQGRGFYPSGNGKDNGVYNGNVAVDLSKFGLKSDNIEVYRVLQNIDGTKAVELTKIDFKVEKNTVIFNINVPILDEIVIGPKGQAEKDFFS